MFGLTSPSGELLPESQWVHRLHPDDWASARKAMTASIVEGRPYAERFRTIQPDGSTRLVLGVGAPFDRNGEHGHFGGWNIDVMSAGNLAGRWLWQHPEALEREHLLAIRLAPHLIDSGAAEAAPFDLHKLRARAIQRARRSRGRFFSSSILGEPAFDMLLTLYVSDVEAVPVSTLAEAAGVPVSTANRWVNHLVRERLVERRAEGDDPTLIALSGRGRAAIDAFLSAK